MGPQPVPGFRTFYENRNLTGTLFVPLFKACFTTFGVLIYLPLMIALCTILAAIPVAWLLGWSTHPQPHTTGPIQTWPVGDIVGFSFIALVGLAVALFMLNGVRRAWASFLRVVRSRVYLGTGRPLATIEGLPEFSGGRPSRGKTSGNPPDKLTVAEITFHLDHCRSPKDLLRIREEKFVGFTASSQGRSYGFSLNVPFRVSYVPSTFVLMSVAIPDRSHAEVAKRAATLRKALDRWYRHNAPTLSPSDTEKTNRLLQELELLGSQLVPGAPEAERKAAEARLDQLENWLGALGVGIG